MKPQGTLERGGRNSKFPRLEATTRALVSVTLTILLNDIPTSTLNLTLSYIVYYNYRKKGHYKSKYPKVVVRIAITKEATIDNPLTLT